MSKLLLFIAGMMTGAVLFTATPSPHASAQAICTEARQEINGASEQACGEALDREQAVFLCNKAGTICWTERI